MSAAEYIGRFAPSPTGPLHLGSLVAAVGSWLDARAHGGTWLVRIDDLDPPREVPGAAEGILRTLHRFGLESDAPPVYQSSRSAAYAEVLEQLRACGDAYGCACSRRDLVEATVYPGTCRGRAVEPRAWRFFVGTGSVGWQDRFAGPQHFDRCLELGDFVIKRADGWWAYHLAAVVDDAAAGVTDVVRGADLLPSTACHIALQERLGLRIPRYGHLPVVRNAAGEKLSKQTLAPPVDARPVGEVLREVFQHLGLPPSTVSEPQAALEEALGAWKRQLQGSRDGGHFDAFAPGTVTA